MGVKFVPEQHQVMFSHSLIQHWFNTSSYPARVVQAVPSVSRTLPPTPSVLGGEGSTLVKRQSAAGRPACVPACLQLRLPMACHPPSPQRYTWEMVQ